MQLHKLLLVLTAAATAALPTSPTPPPFSVENAAGSAAIGAGMSLVVKESIDLHRDGDPCWIPLPLFDPKSLILHFYGPFLKRLYPRGSWTRLDTCICLRTKVSCKDAFLCR